MRNSLQDFNSINLINIPPSIVILSNTSLLAVEMDHVYQLQESHKFLSRVHKNCIIALSLLGENSLKRPKTSNGDDVAQISNLDPAIESINRANMNFKVSRHSNRSLYLSVRTVMNANLIVNNMNIEWVSVLGIEENPSTVHICLVESRYKVFRMIQDQAQAAMLHFCSLDQSVQGIEDFIAWIASYRTLFSAICNGCGLHLRNFMPPLCRHLRTLKEYHVECI